MFTKRTAIVSVINDLVTDNRVMRTAAVLHECGYTVMLVGRSLPASLPLPGWPYKATRFKMIFRSGPLFYFFFNLRLFLYLLGKKADLFYSNDLDTALPNFLVSRLKRVPLVYDSHELFCEVPELQRSTFKKKIWSTVEKLIVPRLQHCITVNNSIASVFETKYRVKFHVVRNISLREPPLNFKTREELGLPAHTRILILQGAGINMDRGAEELVLAMKHLDNTLLLIIGGGDVWPLLEKMTAENGLSDKVRLIKKIPANELLHYTHNADIGLSIDKNTNLNYYYSLPNKIFDYIHSGLPILASRLPEIEKIIERYRIGEFIENHEPAHIAKRIEEMFTENRLKTYRQNCKAASAELSPAAEAQKLKILLESVSGKMYI